MQNYFYIIQQLKCLCTFYVSRTFGHGFFWKGAKNRWLTNDDECAFSVLFSRKISLHRFNITFADYPRLQYDHDKTMVKLISKNALVDL